MRRAVGAVALACALGVAAATPALAVESPSPRYYTADGTDDEYGGPGLTWSGPADYGPGRSGDPDDEAFALGGRGHLAADDASEANFGTRPFTMRFSARFPDAGGGDEQVLSKRATCGAGSFLDVRARDGRVHAELRGPGNRGAAVLHPADVRDGEWHVITVSRTGSSLSVAVDGDAVSRRSDGVVDLDNTAPLRLGDGPCVGDGVTRAEVLLDDVSYGPGPLPTERPLVPGLPPGQPPLDSILAGPGGILAPGTDDSPDDAADDESRASTEDDSGAAVQPVAGPADARAEGAVAEPTVATTEGPALRGRTTPVDFPADSGAAAGIAAAVLPGAGDAADRSAQTGLDWTGSLVAPQAPGQPSGLTVEPPGSGPLVPSLPAPLSGPGSSDHGTAAAAFADALRSPAEVRWDLAAIAQSLLLTLGLLALVALPVGPVNGAVTGTAEARTGRIAAALARLRVPALLAWAHRLPLAGAVTAATAAGAVLYGFLEPSFGFDASSLALVLGLALAFVVIMAVQQVSRGAYMDQWWGIRGRLALAPGFLPVAVACVVASRLVALEPGLILGTVMAFGTAKALRADEEGPAVAVSAVSLLLTGGLAWIFRDVVVAAAGPRSAFLPEVLGAALTAVAVAAAGNLALLLVPLGRFDGAALFRWSKPVWAALAGIGAFAFVHVLLRATADAGALAGRGTFLAVLAGAYLLGAAAFWAWFHYRPGPATTGERERELVG